MTFSLKDGDFYGVQHKALMTYFGGFLLHRAVRRHQRFTG